LTLEGGGIKEIDQHSISSCLSAKCDGFMWSLMDRKL